MPTDAALSSFQQAHAVTLRRIELLAVQLNEWLDTHRRLFLVVVTAIYALSVSGYYHVKTPDPDEVVFMWVARLPTLHDIWAALMAGINIDPPLTQTWVHALFGLFGKSITAARLPETLGFWMLCLAAYSLLARHVPPLFAAATFFLPFASIIRSQSIEARPYGFMLGCAMCAVLCWDAAQAHIRRTLWLAGLSLSIAGCVSSHFFGTLVLFPLALGEAAKILFYRRLDRGSTFAILTGASPLLLWLPIIRSGASVYGKHYFGRLSGDSLYLFYNELILLAGFVVLLLTACFLLSATGQIRFPEQLQLTDRSRLLLAVAGSFLLLPVLGFAYGVLVSHFFVPKYLMLSVFGVIIGLPLAVSILSGRSLLVGLLLLIAFGGHGFFVFSRGMSGFLRKDPDFVSLSEIEATSPQTKGDVVVASAILFETLVEAGGPDSSRLIYLYDPVKAVQYSGTNSSDLVLKALDGRCPARFDSYDHYAALHKRFYILSAGPVAGVNEWIMRHLQLNSARLQFVKTAGVFDLFDVRLPPE